MVVVSFHGGAEGKAYIHVPDSAERYLGERRGDVRRFAPCGLPSILGIASPDDFPVWVRRMPDLRAKPPAALSAAYLCAENGRAAEVARLAVLLNHLLHPIECRRINDGLVAILNVVLRNRAIVLDDLLREVICGVPLLQKCATFVLFIRQDRLDGALTPYLSTLGRLDAHRCQLLGDGLKREALEELPVALMIVLLSSDTARKLGIPFLLIDSTITSRYHLTSDG